MIDWLPLILHLSSVIRLVLESLYFSQYISAMKSVNIKACVPAASIISEKFLSVLCNTFIGCNKETLMHCVSSSLLFSKRLLDVTQMRAWTISSSFISQDKPTDRPPKFKQFCYCILKGAEIKEMNECRGVVLWPSRSPERFELLETALSINHDQNTK